MKITRFDPGPYEGTPGSLVLKDGRSYRTLELPWKDNENNVSCIPEGTYKLRVRPASESHKFNYDHIEVLGVPGRDKILIHIGNYLRNTDGCVLVGLWSSWQNNKWIVNSSRIAFGIVLEAVRRGDSTLAVERGY